MEGEGPPVELLGSRPPGPSVLRAVPEIILRGVGGPQALFCSVGGRCFVDNVSERWGWGWVGVICPGGQGIFDP